MKLALCPSCGRYGGILDRAGTRYRCRHRACQHQWPRSAPVVRPPTRSLALEALHVLLAEAPRAPDWPARWQDAHLTWRLTDAR